MSLISSCGSDTEKNIMKRTEVWNVEIRTEGTLTFWKWEYLLKKMSKYQNTKIDNNGSIKLWRWTCVVTWWFEKIIDISTFVLDYQFERRRDFQNNVKSKSRTGHHNSKLNEIFWSNFKWLLALKSWWLFSAPAIHFWRKLNIKLKSCIRF